MDITPNLQRVNWNSEQLEEEIDDEKRYVPKRIQAVVFAFDRTKITFSDTLCTIPEFIVITNAGQAVAYYESDDPPLPYDTLQELLEEHAQGCRSADYLRAHLEELDEVPQRLVTDGLAPDTKAPLVSYSFADLKVIVERAREYWGSFAVTFVPRIV